MKRAQDFGHGTPPRSGTVYLAAADASGLMVSFIQSNYMGFGSGVVVDGISLQNRGATFVLEKGHPNCVGPRKRPYQTIIPGFVTREGRPVMSFGVMGGTMQPQGHAQVMVRIADYGQSPQAACDGPRFRVVQGMDVSVEKPLPAAVADELKRRGHRIVSCPTTTTSSAARSSSGSSTAAISPPAIPSRRSGRGVLMLKIWGRVNSVNVKKVLWAAEELGLNTSASTPAGSSAW